jgi:NADH:ubiquinone oxidoreductase subunit K
MTRKIHYAAFSAAMVFMAVAVGIVYARTLAPDDKGYILALLVMSLASVFGAVITVFYVGKNWARIERLPRPGTWGIISTVAVIAGSVYLLRLS